MRIALAFVAPAILAAQQATLSGLVRDRAQSPIPDAKLNVLQVETGVERTAKSDGSGAYAVTALAAGVYRITIEAGGFQPKTVERVELAPGQNARLDIRLEGVAAEIRGVVRDG